MKNAIPPRRDKIQNFKKIKRNLAGIQKNILLKKHTTFKIGGRAKYFFAAKTEEDLIKALKLAKQFKLPFFVLGGGSNILISDKGYEGLVIKMQNAKKMQSRQGGTKFKIFCEGGTPLAKLVSQSLIVGVSGLEWAAGIPGTVGGAICGNAGAFGKSMKDIVIQVKMYDVKSQKVKILENKDCKFDYRNSVFRQNKNLVILSATLKLKEDNQKEIERQINRYLSYRKKTQPLNFPSAGSIFKNTKDFSAGELIENCGLKGKKIGQAQISEKHANFIVNLGLARAKDVKKLINLAKQKVKNKFKINLEEEICIIPPKF